MMITARFWPEQWQPGVDISQRRRMIGKAGLRGLSWRLQFGYVNCEVPIRHPIGDIHVWSSGNSSRQFRELQI